MPELENFLKAKIAQTFFVKGPSVKEVVAFLNRPGDAAQYAKAVKVLKRVTEDCDVSFKNSGLLKARILCTLTDGTVWFDSSKTNNTHEAFKKKLINDNHNTRPSVLNAIKHGEGYEKRHSTTDNLSLQEYLAVRLGASKKEAKGTIVTSAVHRL